MTDPASTTLRWLRGLLLGAVATLTGSLAHVGADGLMPGAAGTTAILAATTVAALPFLGRQVPTAGVVLLLMAGQTLVHGLLSLLSGHRGDRPVPARLPVLNDPGVPRVGSFREQMTALHAAASPGDAATHDPVGHLVGHVLEQSPLMLLGHTAAAALVGLWLAAGEQALFTVLALTAATSPAVRAATGGLLAVAAKVACSVQGTADLLRTARRLSAGSRPVVLVLHLATGAVDRRGPPALRAV